MFSKFSNIRIIRSFNDSNAQKTKSLRVENYLYLILIIRLGETYYE
jgi:hypothetical protein